MQAKRVFGVVSSAILVFLAACGGDDDNNGSGASAFTHDYCEIHEGLCCTQNGQTYDAQSCEGLLGLASVAGTFDKAAADACIAALKAAQSSPTFCADKGGADAAAKCDAVYKSAGGNVAPGGACESDSECAPVANAEVLCTFATDDFNSHAEICQARLRGTAGADCAGQRVSNSSLGALTSTTSKDPQITICWEEDSLSCNTQTNKCTPPSALGEKCSPSEYLSCAVDQYCGHADETSDDYVCVARGKLDEACNFYESSCASDLHCEQVKKKCLADTPIGGTCDPQVPSCGAHAECTNAGVCKAVSASFSLFCK